MVCTLACGRIKVVDFWVKNKKIQLTSSISWIFMRFNYSNLNYKRNTLEQIIYCLTEPLIEISTRRFCCKQAMTDVDLGPLQVTKGCVEPTPVAVIK